MSIVSLKASLDSIPFALRDPLIEEFEQALDEYRSADWEKVGLKAGKFCEIAYCICAGYALDMRSELTIGSGVFFRLSINGQMQTRPSTSNGSPLA